MVSICDLQGLHVHHAGCISETAADGWTAAVDGFNARLSFSSISTLAAAVGDARELTAKVSISSKS